MRTTEDDGVEELIQKDVVEEEGGWKENVAKRNGERTWLGFVLCTIIREREREHSAACDSFSPLPLIISSSLPGYPSNPANPLSLLPLPPPSSLQLDESRRHTPF